MPGGLTGTSPSSRIIRRRPILGSFLAEANTINAHLTAIPGGGERRARRWSRRSRTTAVRRQFDATQGAVFQGPVRQRTEQWHAVRPIRRPVKGLTGILNGDTVRTRRDQAMITAAGQGFAPTPWTSAGTQHRDRGATLLCGDGDATGGDGRLSCSARAPSRHTPANRRTADSTTTTSGLAHAPCWDAPYDTCSHGTTDAAAAAPQQQHRRRLRPTSRPRWRSSTNTFSTWHMWGVSPNATNCQCGAPQEKLCSAAGPSFKGRPTHHVLIDHSSTTADRPRLARTAGMPREGPLPQPAEQSRANAAQRQAAHERISFLPTGHAVGFSNPRAPGIRLATAEQAFRRVVAISPGISAPLRVWPWSGQLGALDEAGT